MVGQIDESTWLFECAERAIPYWLRSCFNLNLNLKFKTKLFLFSFLQFSTQLIWSPVTRLWSTNSWLPPTSNVFRVKADRFQPSPGRETGYQSQMNYHTGSNSAGLVPWSGRKHSRLIMYARTFGLAYRCSINWAVQPCFAVSLR